MIPRVAPPTREARDTGDSGYQDAQTRDFSRVPPGHPVPALPVDRGHEPGTGRSREP